MGQRILLLLTTTIFVASCGRSAPVAKSETPDTKAAERTFGGNTPITLAGTFEQPSEGAKATSRNTVLPAEEAAQQAQAQSTSTPPAPAPPTTMAPTTSATRAHRSQPENYTVQPGDTLSTIANHKFGITLKELLDANGLSSDAIIKPGQELTIPANS